MHDIRKHKQAHLFLNNVLIAQGIYFTTTSAPYIVYRTGSRIELNCSVDAFPNRNGSYIMWTKGGARVLNGSRIYVNTNNTLIISNALLPDTGSYKCSALAGGQTISTTTQLTVNDVPGKPRYVVLFNKMKESVNVYWTFTHGQDHNSPILAYRIEYRSNHNQTIRVQNVTHPMANNATVKLSPWGQYVFRVAGINTVGVVPYNAPKGLRVEGSGRYPNRLFVSWMALPGEEQNAPGIGYMLYYKLDSDRFYTNLNVSNVNSYFINNLLRERYYDIYIQPYNNLGIGLRTTTIVRGFTSEAPPRSPPVNFRTTEIEANSIAVRWDGIPQNFIEGTLRGYTLRIWDVRAPGRSTNYTVGPNTLTYVFYGLMPYTVYEIEAFGRSRSSGRSYSARIVVRTRSSKPDPVMQLAAGAISTGNVVAANWVRPARANGIIIGYSLNITYTLTGRAYQYYGSYLLPGNVHHFSLSRVPRGTYVFTVSAENAAGFGPSRRAQAYASGDDYAPYNYLAKAVSNSRIEISWLVVKNPIRFEVRLREARNDSVWYKYGANIPGTARQITLDGIDGTKNYYVRMVSILNTGRNPLESSPTPQALAAMSSFEENLPPFNRAWFVILFVMGVILALILVYMIYRQFRSGPVQEPPKETHRAPRPPPQQQPLGQKELLLMMIVFFVLLQFNRVNQLIWAPLLIDDVCERRLIDIFGY
ncbi:Protein sidekick-1 [Trichoplax sp. H2]|nr:Protein sidekick-1 [Trichoplax sp. H2]|eukprot:RDD42508.1 Protein sidekick-1 [Trichoplax sp. H2]